MAFKMAYFKLWVIFLSCKCELLGGVCLRNLGKGKGNGNGNLLKKVLNPCLFSRGLEKVLKFDQNPQENCL